MIPVRRTHAGGLARPRSLRTRSRTTVFSTSPRPCAQTGRCPARGDRGCEQLAASAQAAPFAAAQAARVVWRTPDAEIFALCLADPVLAARLKWPLPLPLIAGALLIRHSTADTGPIRAMPTDAPPAPPYGRAAVTACDLLAELGRSSQQLIARRSPLRAKGAGAVIKALLDETPCGRRRAAAP